MKYAIFFFLSFFSLLFSNIERPHHLVSKNRYVNTLASLSFFVSNYEKKIRPHHPEDRLEILQFTNKNAAVLWARIDRHLQDDPEQEVYKNFQQAKSLYREAKEQVKQKHHKLARSKLLEANKILRWLLKKELEDELTDEKILDDHPIDPNIQNNPLITEHISQAIHPFLLSLDHPKRQVLDSIFKNRITQNKHTFNRGGFQTIASGSRSFILVAKHPKLRGYLIKCFLDSEKRKKFDRESWEWLVHRCKGAHKIKKIIQNQNIHYFEVAEKWIYCLPNPNKFAGQKNQRHVAALLVTDMHLVSQKKNLSAWAHKITPNHLNELFKIIVRAKGSSYRPDNIALTKDGKFAFIDTEYPSAGPDFMSIRPFLSSKMRLYWDSLIRMGGPKKRVPLH